MLCAVAASAALAGAFWPAVTFAADDDADAQAPVTTQSISPTAKSTAVSEIVVNGIPYKETVLPTRMPSS